MYTLYTLYTLYAHTEGAGQGVGDVCAHTSKNTSKYTDFSYSNSYTKYTAMLSSRVLYLHARLRTASIRCKLTPRGLIKAHSMHLLAIGGPMVLGKQVPDHIATANADWKHTTNRAAMARETLQIKCIHTYCRATIAHSVDAEGSNRATHLTKLGTHSLLSLQAPCLEACVFLLLQQGPEGTICPHQSSSSRSVR